MLRALTYDEPSNDIKRRTALFDKIDLLLRNSAYGKVGNIKPHHQDPGPLTEHEFFFDSGNRSMKYVCFGQSRSDAQVTAQQAMAGSYFKLREE